MAIRVQERWWAHVPLSTSRIEPSFFGRQQLFGVYHPPSTRVTRSCAVLLCSPFGREYIESHRTVCRLALSLSHRGFPTLRFDLSGCGDSAGEFEDATIDAWLEDVTTGIDALRAFAGARRTAVVGLRLGAALVAMAGSRRDDIEAMTLWHPVVNGRDYLRDLHAQHRAENRTPLLQWLKTPLRGSPEIRGFPLTRPLASDLSRIDLLALTQRPSARVLIVDATTAPARTELTTRFEHLGAQVVRLITAEKPPWVQPSDGWHDFVDQPTTRHSANAILDWLMEWERS